MKKIFLISVAQIMMGTIVMAAGPNAGNLIDPTGTQKQRYSSSLTGAEEWIDQTKTSSYHDIGHVITRKSTLLIKALIERKLQNSKNQGLLKLLSA
jgi:hypothetical protein